MVRDKERPGYVLLVATLVCVVCALLVSASVVVLRPVQDRNALLQRQRNILEVAGLYQAGQPVDGQFARIEPHLVDLASGDYVEGADAVRFDIAKRRATQAERPGARRGGRREDPPPAPGDAGVPGPGRDGHRHGDPARARLRAVVDDVRLRGARRARERVKGVTFYAHAETPGLGAEIENLRWRESWVGKRLTGDDGSVRFDIAKASPRRTPPTITWTRFPGPRSPATAWRTCALLAGRAGLRALPRAAEERGRLTHERRDAQGAVRAAGRQQPDHRADPGDLLGARDHLEAGTGGDHVDRAHRGDRLLERAISAIRHYIRTTSASSCR